MNYEKMNRSEWLTYLDVTPTATSMDLEVLGVGITDMAIAYNPTVDSEKWIIEDAARHIHNANEKQAAVSQTIYKNDPCYQFVKNGRDKLNYTTHIVDVDRTNEISDGVYYAEMTNGLIAIDTWMGENASVEYTLYYEGDKVTGTVSFDASTGKPTFTPDASL